ICCSRPNAWRSPRPNSSFSRKQPKMRLSTNSCAEPEKGSSGSPPNWDRVGVANPFLRERAAVKKKYQRAVRKSNHKLEIVRGQELLVRVPLPMAEVWAEMQAQVERLTGQAGLQILQAILEDEVTRRVGPPHRPHPTAGCVRWGKQPGYVVFGGQKVPLERPRVRTHEGEEVELDSC